MHMRVARPGAGALELAADDALTHEKSDYWITKKPSCLSG
jgi:hypothetical protein